MVDDVSWRGDGALGTGVNKLCAARVDVPSCFFVGDDSLAGAGPAQAGGGFGVVSSFGGYDVVDVRVMVLSNPDVDGGGVLADNLALGLPQMVGVAILGAVVGGHVDHAGAVLPPGFVQVVLALFVLTEFAVGTGRAEAMVDDECGPGDTSEQIIGGEIVIYVAYDGGGDVKPLRAPLSRPLAIVKLGFKVVLVVPQDVSVVVLPSTDMLVAEHFRLVSPTGSGTTNISHLFEAKIPEEEEASEFDLPPLSGEPHMLAGSAFGQGHALPHVGKHVLASVDVDARHVRPDGDVPIAVVVGNAQQEDNHASAGVGRDSRVEAQEVGDSVAALANEHAQNECDVSKEEAVLHDLEAGVESHPARDLDEVLEPAEAMDGGLARGISGKQAKHAEGLYVPVERVFGQLHPDGVPQI